MKKTIMMMAATAGIASAVLADQPGPNWLSQAALTKLVAMQGYRITKVEADDGQWEGEMTRGQTFYEFHADPLSGHLTKIEPKHDD